MKYILYTILFVLSLQSVFATSCNDSLMHDEFIRLETYNRSFGHRLALNYADSLQAVLGQNGLEDCKTYALISLKKGESLELAFEFEKAIQLYYQLLAKTKELDYKDIEIEVYICIARVHEALDRKLDCKRNLSIARELMDKYQQYKSMGHYAVRYSSYHRIYENRDTAIHYAKLAIELGKDMTPNIIELDGTFLMAILTPGLDNSLPYFKRVIDLNLENKSYYGAALQSLNIASRFNKAQQYENAYIYLQKGEFFALKMSEKDIGYNYAFYRLYDKKRDYFILKNNLDSAYYFANLSHEYHIKSIRETDQEKIDQIEIQQAVDAEKAKVEILETQRNFFFWTVIMGSLAIVILIYFIINHVRDKKKIAQQNEALANSLSKQTTLLSEIHHRVKNNLQLVISLLILQSQKTNEEVTKSQLRNISDKVTSIALIHDQLYQQGEFDAINLQLYFNDLFNNFKQLKDFDFNITCNDIRLNLETVIPLGIISAELINNSIKHFKSNHLKLDLTITQNNDKFHMFYKDNGKGYTQENLYKSQRGMGTMLIFSMIRQLKATSESYNQDGAVFELIFKEKHISNL